ncbi:YfdX family protein [Massilia pseudoviolaceinigra]|uniref:YfdX family protein n=1 Tax=Massilia pseudoviolaceinigra TaxID=3057165 RepID=UPI0027964BE5|nr:YfdX family protein [Massilia sp. CCM 9206]MDQ1924822.1 YfdX family protein [Massilia sp. CCM 9206]
MDPQNRTARRGSTLVAGLLIPLYIHAANQTPPPKAEPQSQASQAVQPQVDKRTADAALQKQRELMAEAQSAIAETEKALKALDEKRNRDALAALASATGTLELLLARSPKLALAPIRTDVVTHDLLASNDTVKAAVKEVRDRLRDGEVQKARQLMQGLASEVEFRTLNIPLETYPAAIKAITPLIDAGKIEEAKMALRTMLNTLVVTTEVVPLPKLRAEEQIKAAQALAEKANRSKEENDRLAQSIAAARDQLKIAELLGYGDKKDYKPMYQQIDELEKKTAGGKSGMGWFEKLKQQLAAWM